MGLNSKRDLALYCAYKSQPHCITGSASGIDCRYLRFVRVCMCVCVCAQIWHHTGNRRQDGDHAGIWKRWVLCCEVLRPVLWCVSLARVLTYVCTCVSLARVLTYVCTHVQTLFCLSYARYTRTNVYTHNTHTHTHTHTHTLTHTNTHTHTQDVK